MNTIDENDKTGAASRRLAETIGELMVRMRDGQMPPRVAELFGRVCDDVEVLVRAISGGVGFRP
jgi:hypothetical protein